MALEFEWIFKEAFSIKFIEKLADSENDELFAIATVRIMIEFLWGKFFGNIIYKVFIPFVFYMLSFVFYATFVFPTER